MRDLRRNQVAVTYRQYLESKEIVDKWGNSTAEYEPVFGEEQTLLMSVSANKGAYSEQMFGGVLDYDRVMLISDPNCPIDEHSRLTIDGKTYVVKAVARSLNVTQYAIKRVDINENNGQALGGEP
ncbi:MAG: hypothetical protein NC299_17145 [Lachnospiraceae bacterium]|nr:hypothetical protein [Ruminococcus sp.]MCM1277058.1 hypothetical protein [Lachnospiraceae bacterium]